MKSFRNFVWNIGFLDQPILVHNPGYVVLTQFVIVASELFVSTEIKFTDLPAGFCRCSCTPIKGSMLLPRILAPLPSTTVNETVLIVQPPDSMGALTLPNDGIL